jgi:cytochrome c-type biogenesis protein CcmH/NrfF
VALLWVVPVMVLLVGAAAMVSVVRQTTDTARELVDEVVRFGELHVALARVRSEIVRGTNGARGLRGR